MPVNLSDILDGTIPVTAAGIEVELDPTNVDGGFKNTSAGVVYYAFDKELYDIDPAVAVQQGRGELAQNDITFIPAGAKTFVAKTASGTSTLQAVDSAGTNENLGLGAIAAEDAPLAVAKGGTGRSTATAYMPVAGGTTATGAHQSVAAGAAVGQALTYQGVAALPSYDYVGNGLPSAQYEICEHFIVDDSSGDNVNRNNDGSSGTNSGTGSGFSWSNSYAGRCGVVKFQTGTDAGGYSYRLSTNTTVLVFGTGEFVNETGIYIEDLSDGTNTFTVRSGFLDVTNGDPTDGCFFRYAHTENGGNWTLVCRSNGVETTADSGVAVAADIWYALRVVVNSDASSVVFYINGTLVGTVVANIPSGSARATSMGSHILKSAGSTSRDMYLDYNYMRYRP